MEKDALIEAYYRNGRFPADRGAHKTPEGRIVRGAGHIETEIKSNYWYEFLQIFAPVGLLALVLYMFYNALPTAYTESLNKQDVTKNVEARQRTPSSVERQKTLTHTGRHVSTDQDSAVGKAMNAYTALSKSPAVRNVVQLPELTREGLKDEMAKHQPALDTILTQKNALQDLKTQLPPSRARIPPKAPQQKAMEPKQTSPARKATSQLTTNLQKPAPSKSITAKPSPKAVTTKSLTENSPRKLRLQK